MNRIEKKVGQVWPTFEFSQSILSYLTRKRPFFAIGKVSREIAKFGGMDQVFLVTRILVRVPARGDIHTGHFFSFEIQPLQNKLLQPFKK